MSLYILSSYVGKGRCEYNYSLTYVRVFTISRRLKVTCCIEYALLVTLYSCCFHERKGTILIHICAISQKRARYGLGRAEEAKLGWGHGPGTSLFVGICWCFAGGQFSKTGGGDCVLH